MVYTSISTSTYLGEFQVSVEAVINVLYRAFKYSFAMFLSALN
jgi:hypothetical protein